MILPLAKGVPAVGLTLIGVLPPIVNTSASVVELAVTVTVIVVDVITAGVVAVNSGVVPVTATSGTDDVLNSKPDGMAKTKLPVAISPAAPSVITIEPSDVQDTPAVSADIAPPPLAGVTVASADTGTAKVRLSAITAAMKI